MNDSPAASQPADDAAATSTAGLAAQIFARKPEAELLYLAQHAGRYPPAVGAAAVAELARRGLLPGTAPPKPPAPPAPPDGWLSLLGQLLRGLFWPSKGYFAVPLLLLLNVLVFGLMVLSGVSATDPTGHELAQWGSNVSDRTLHGQPWRLLTSQFVHGGLSHLALNMFSLWLLGTMLEARVGGRRLLAVYLASGVGGALATLWYHPLINSVGASGAIFGLYGFLLLLLLSRKMVLDKSDRRALLGLVIYLVLSNLISGLSGNTDNAAHVGGLLAGAFFAGPLALLHLPPESDHESPSA